MLSSEKETEKSEKLDAMSIVGLVICILLLPILLINTILIVKSRVNQDRIPTAFGMFPMIVLTDSMVPTIHSGDLVICRSAAPESVEVNDIICYYSRPSINLETVTHRVQQVQTAEDGTLTWITKGDANNTEDTKPVERGQLVGVYCFRIPGFGRAAMFMQSGQGMMTCIVLPLLALIVYDMIRRRQYEIERQREANAMQIQMDILRSRKQTEERLQRSEDTNR